jgi:ADP-heptose:LPS heptosyltransferase
MILISPYAKPLRNGGNNPKNYPAWKEVVSGLNGEEIIQIGAGDEKAISNKVKLKKNLSFAEIEELVNKCRVWVSIDTFLPHMAHHLGKPGVVIFGQSDPNIFGYPENKNLLVDRKYLRPDQFLIWEQAEYIKEAFVKPEVVVESIRGVA